MGKENEIINEVRKWLQEHKAIKDKKKASEFNGLNFFKIDENKITKILAYFLNPYEKHGQGNVFLKEFVDVINNNVTVNCNGKLNNLDYRNIKVKREKATDENRRIDLYIKIDDFVIAIENKLWAKDQPEQLKDYSTFLREKNNTKFLILYLTPFKKQPTLSSISQEKWGKMIKAGNAGQITYVDDVFMTLDRWTDCSEADNVTQFIIQLKQYMQSIFLGRKNVLISKQMKDLVLKNQEEVEVLIANYNEIENELFSIIKKASKSENIKEDSPIENVLFENDKKDGITLRLTFKNGENKISVRLFNRRVKLFMNCSFEPESNLELKKALEESNLKNDLQIPYDTSYEEIIKLFSERIKKAKEILDNHKN